MSGLLGESSSLPEAAPADCDDSEEATAASAANTFATSLRCQCGSQPGQDCFGIPFYDGTCAANDATWHQAGENADIRGCDWVAEQPRARCDVPDAAGVQAHTACKAACYCCGAAFGCGAPSPPSAAISAPSGWDCPSSKCQDGEWTHKAPKCTPSTLLSTEIAAEVAQENAAVADTDSSELEQISETSVMEDTDTEIAAGTAVADAASAAADQDEVPPVGLRCTALLWAL